MSQNTAEKSKLLNLLNKLNIVSKESTNSGEEFGLFNEYMHVERQIQTDLLSVLKSQQSVNKHIVFLAGSSGDGKSHLFSYIREKYGELVDGYEFYRDATESDDLDLEAEEVLEKKLINFSDSGLSNGLSNKMIVAINLGIMSNFISRPSVNEKYKKMVSFICDSGILEEGNIKRVSTDGAFSIVNFSGYNDLEIYDGEMKSPYITSIFEKVFSRRDDNIFYRAYLEDKANGLMYDYHINYSLMLNEKIKKSVVNILIMAKLNKNLIIPTRMIFNFIYKILVPSDDIHRENNMNLELFLKNSLPELIFSNVSQNKLLKPIQDLDILKIRLLELDKVISKLFVDGMLNIVNEYFSENGYEEFTNQLERFESEIKQNNSQLKELYIRVISRLIWLGQVGDMSDYYKSFNEYVYYLEGYNNGDLDRIQELIDFVHKAIYLWIGDGETSYIKNQKTPNIYMSFQVDIQDAFENIPKREENASLFTSMIIPFKEADTDVSSEIEIDFSLFKLLYSINNGYRPNSKDEEKAISFIKSINNLTNVGRSKTELLLSKDANSVRYILKKKKKLGQDVYEFGRKI